MATKAYLEQLNKALPVNSGDYGTNGPDANSLHELALQALVKNEPPPPLGDATTPTVKVVASTNLTSGSSWCGSYSWVNKNPKQGGAGWGSDASYSDITGLAHTFLRVSQIAAATAAGEEPTMSTETETETETDSRETNETQKHVLAVWIPKCAEAEIHLGESNIPRSIHDIAVQMHLRTIKFSIFSIFFLGDEDDESEEEDGAVDHLAPFETLASLLRGDDVQMSDNPLAAMAMKLRSENLLGSLMMKMDAATKHFKKCDLIDFRKHSLPQLQATVEKNVKEMLLCSSESEFPPDETDKDAAVAHFIPAKKKRKKDSDSDEEADTTQNVAVVVHIHPFDRIFEGISDNQLAEMFKILIYKHGDAGCVLCPNGDIGIVANEQDGKLKVRWENQYWLIEIQEAFILFNEHTYYSGMLGTVRVV